MKTELMKPGEAFVAAQNMREIQKYLDEPIPPGMLDATQYGNRLLSGGEAYTIATNLRTTMKQMDVMNGVKKRDYYHSRQYDRYFADNENKTLKESVADLVAVMVICGVIFIAVLLVEIF